ncbi:alpha-N-acetylglucosaminidase C-terminal domain-containing protein [Herbihabitans rhizosphaerae]|uniref:alpha-N-acetylglucosaminidase C-terminal domain-containing protein n=1 Tax=Herbihabitans rhizosphaerae TaxID=1872711 RepID=UPI003BF81C3D
MRLRSRCSPSWPGTPSRSTTGAGFADYAERRYGTTDPRAVSAWGALRRGPYDMLSGEWSEPQDSLYAARPSLTVRTAAAWSPTSMRYDLVNTARQVLANRSRTLLPEIKAAYDAADLPRFRALAAEWKGDMDLLERLLASDPRFLVGPWLRDVKAWGTTDSEKRTLEYDARSIMTTWGHRASSDGGPLHDYANRELSGLVADFYAMRWTRYLDTLDTALATGTPPAPIDWFAIEDAWNRETKTYPVAATGDPYRLAIEVAAR